MFTLEEAINEFKIGFYTSYNKAFNSMTPGLVEKEYAKMIAISEIRAYGYARGMYTAEGYEKCLRTFVEMFLEGDIANH